MPELPEVETIRRRLEAALVGATIRDVVLNDSSVCQMSEAQLRALIDGRRITALRRRGKYLLIDLGDVVAIVHLRMTGQLLLRVESSCVPLAGRQPRFALRLTPDVELSFRDVRRFGRLWALPAAEERDFFAGMGPEPFGDEFTVMYLRAALEGRRAPLKAFLLDQRRLAGVGNIYADEALFRARLHPLRAAGSVGPREAQRLHAAILETLQAGIDHNGSSIESFLDPAGQPGTFQDILNVYQRTGQPCRVCSAPVRRVVVGGRGTHFCAHCQPYRAGRSRHAASPADEHGAT